MAVLVQKAAVQKAAVAAVLGNIWGCSEKQLKEMRTSW